MTQIRLADKEGLLSGPHLNPVQAYCNVLLDVLARIDRAERRDRELRLALMASGFFEDPADLFDEFKNVITDDNAEIDDGADQRGEAIATKWDFTAAELNRTQEEVEEEIRQMLAAASEGSASFDMPEYEDWV